MNAFYKTLSAAVFFTFFAFSANACWCLPLPTLDSLAQLKEYDFIALVKINDNRDTTIAGGNQPTRGNLTFTIKELFKGQPVNIILDRFKNTSCDIGIEPGQERILFGKTFQGQLSVMSCDRNSLYRKENGERDWQYEYAFPELDKLRKLYHHQVTPYPDGKRVERYPNGQVETEETYANGKLNGERTIWYANGALRSRQSFSNGLPDGKSEWFYPSGLKQREEFFLKGKNYNIARSYFDTTVDEITLFFTFKKDKRKQDSALSVHKRIQVSYEMVYDTRGRDILWRQYNRDGTIYAESITDPETHITTSIHYHPNGRISYISYIRNGRSYDHLQEYSKDGLPLKRWDYDENGKVIKQKE